MSKKNISNLLFYVYDDKCESKHNFRLRNDFTLKIFKPSFVDLKQHSSGFLIYIFWYIFSLGGYRIIYVYNSKNEIIHYTHIIRKIFKYPFMKKHDLFIGPSWTKEKYRGWGIYSYVIDYIITRYKQGNKRILGIVKEENIISQSGVLKSGFRLYGYGYKSRVLGIYRISHYAVET